MVLERPSAPARRNGLRSRGTPPMTELLPLQPSEPPSPEASEASGVSWERVGFDRYELRDGDTTVGFIDVVGAVYVVLEGSRYDRAVEVRQTLDFTVASHAIDPCETRAPVDDGSTPS